ncbi:MAG: GNAT family N-acetyltransferase [Phycisphaerae bacterium]
MYAVAGYRISESLSRGYHLYVDDLVTAEQVRSQGLGKLLLQWLIAEARREKCQHLVLDSGVQRFAAHRFYLRHGMSITAHHFCMEV